MQPKQSRLCRSGRYQQSWRSLVFVKNTKLFGVGGGNPKAAQWGLSIHNGHRILTVLVGWWWNRMEWNILEMEYPGMEYPWLTGQNLEHQCSAVLILWQVQLGFPHSSNQGLSSCLKFGFMRIQWLTILNNLHGTVLLHNAGKHLNPPQTLNHVSLWTEPITHQLEDGVAHDGNEDTGLGLHIPSFLTF